MDENSGQSTSKGASLHYILKATAVCGAQCKIPSKSSIAEEDFRCLDSCGTNAAASRIAHLKFVSSHSEPEDQ